ncbi:MAG: hypothetical protein RLZZ440_1018, partial [Planctomycetota bacterium]
MLTDLLILLALVLGYGVLSAAEMAIVASRRGRLRPQAEDGDAVARAAVDLAANPDRFLPAVRIAATLIVSVAAARGSRWIVPRVAEAVTSLWPAAGRAAETVAFWAFVLALGFTILVLGELVPKRLALRHPEAFARLGVPLLGLLRRATAPLVWAANAAASALLLLAGERRGEEPTVSVDEIEELLEAGRAE